MNLIKCHVCDQEIRSHEDIYHLHADKRAHCSCVCLCQTMLNERLIGVVTAGKVDHIAWV